MTTWSTALQFVTAIWIGLLFVAHAPSAGAQWNFADSNGAIIETESDGPEPSYLPDMLARAKSDVYTGSIIGRYANGDVKVFIRLRRGDVERVITYFPGKRVDSNFALRDGLFHGQAALLYPDGTRKADLTYLQGQLHGSMSARYPNGNIAYKGLILNGEPFNVKKWDEDGNPLGDADPMELMAFLDAPAEINWEDLHALAVIPAAPATLASETVSAPAEELVLVRDSDGRVKEVRQHERVTRLDRDAGGFLRAASESGADVLDHQLVYDRHPHDKVLVSSVTLFSEDEARTVTYAYDYNLQSLASDRLHVTYERVEGRPWLVRTSVRWGDHGPVLVRSTEFGPGPQLLSLLWRLGAETIDGIRYTYHQHSDQVRSAEQSDGTTWVYAYDRYDHLTRAALQETSSGLPVPGMQFQYEFDDIGNITLSAETSARLVHRFSADNFNQHVERRWDPGVNIIDLLRLDDEPLLQTDDSLARRVGRYQSQRLRLPRVKGRLLANLADEVATPIQNRMRSRWVPPVREEVSFTPARRMMRDARFTYRYTLTGQLASVIPLEAAFGPRVDFAYYPSGARATKRVYQDAPGTLLVREHHYIYDRTLLVREVILSGAGGAERIVRDFIWGLDLVGQVDGRSMVAAGGIGGLLAILETQSGHTRAYGVVSDRMGTVRKLVDLEHGGVVAEYLVTPLGEPIGEWGPASDACPFRLHTRYYDEESALYCYASRYFHPASAKWITASDRMSLINPNETSFCRNDPVNRFSAYGE